MMISVVLTLGGLIIFLLYKYVKSKTSYWSDRGGVIYDKGNISWDFFMQDRGFFEITNDIYKKYPGEPAVGSLALLRPALIVCAPENIQEVLAGDFNSFNDRGFHVNGKIDKLADNVLVMNGIRWKLTRQKMTPLFTSAKLRNMYYIMDKSGRDFVEYLHSGPKEKSYDVLTSFCSAAIGAAVFGLHTKSTMDSPFLDMARKASSPSAALTLKFAILGFSPKLFEILRLKVFGDFEEFFIGSIKKVLRIREQQATRTHDFADLCVALQRQGTLRDPATGYEIEPTDELLAAQAFFFFIAGVEPSATSMFFTLFELAKNPAVLEKLQAEVDALFERCDGNPTYEAVTEFTYLDMVLDEAMRMHPAIGVISRNCTQNGGVLPVGKISVEKDTALMIPVHAIHHDPKYYPEPEAFKPERFSAENKQKINNYTYMPFGEGHRMCLGLRFARLQVKTGLVHLLRHYSVETSDAHTVPKYSKLPVQVRATNIDVQFVRRTSK